MLKNRSSSLSRGSINAIAGCGDAFASAARAAAWSRQLPAVLKNEMALRTGGGLQNETPLPISGDRLHDMNEVVLDLPLRDAEHLRELVRGKSRSAQQFDHALPRRPWYRQHPAILGKNLLNSKLNGSPDFGRMKAR
jgi:hypothetical protein